MLMVVAGHLTGNMIVDGCMPQWYSNFNIGIAMPLFFIISGYFSNKSFERGISRIISRIIILLWPLAVFGLIFGTILFVTGKIPFYKAILYPLVRVYGGGWFLSTLAILYAVTAIVWNLSKRTVTRLIIIIIVYALCFFSAEQGRIASILRISNVLDMMPYFVFGLFLPYLKWHQNKIISICCGVIFLSVVFLEGDIHTNGMGFYWVPKNWRIVLADSHLMMCFFARTMVGITGTVFVLWIMDRILTLLPIISKLSVLGTTTLGVYVIHEWPLVQIHKYFDIAPLSSVWQWPLTFALFFICHYMTAVIDSNSWLKFFFFGDEAWLAGVLEKGLRRK
jgi:surface polysaccharide O-acyltransferase-like enzyme